MFAFAQVQAKLIQIHIDENFSKDSKYVRTSVNDGNISNYTPRTLCTSNAMPLQNDDELQTEMCRRKYVYIKFLFVLSAFVTALCVYLMAVRDSSVLINKLKCMLHPRCMNTYCVHYAIGTAASAIPVLSI